MTDSVIELIQLENGDIELRQEDAPVLTIQFSEMLNNMLDEAKLDIARSMIEAGISRFNDIQAHRMQEIHADSKPDVLH